jgi:spore coat protein A, manganese oxidase
MRCPWRFLVVSLLLLPVLGWGAQTPQLPIAGTALPQFVEPLPALRTLPGNGPITLRMCEFKANVLPAGAVPGYTGTWVWGYLPGAAGTSCAALIAQYATANGALDTYIGPVIVNQRGTPTPITFVNDLGSAATTQVLAYKYSTDQTLHWADPFGAMCSMAGMVPMFGSLCAQNYNGPVPAVPHLHGGEVPAELDGGPDAWFTSDGSFRGPNYYSSGATLANGAQYPYPNVQEAAPLWFHDHTLGATRLNVYAGLAGAYFIYDPALALPSNLQPLTEVIPLVLQDRMFDTTGQLFFPADSAAGLLWTTNPDHPYWVPEFVGDTIVVNGKVWPFVNVEPKRYRFLFLNGSNARTYELFLTNPVTKINGPSLHVIGTDGGYLDAAVTIDPNALKPAPQHLILMPGERYEAIVDFGALLPGTTLVLKNVAKTPFPGGATPSGSMDKIVQFRVVPCTTACGAADASFNAATNAPIRTDPEQKIVRLVNPATGTLAAGVVPSVTRELTLNEVMGMPMMATDPVTGLMTAYPGGPLEVLLNNTKWMDAVTERPAEGSTEVWEIVNITADAHPIHLHLVQFQLLNRQNLNVGKFTAAYNLAFPGGVFVPASGPPLSYTPSAASGGKYGGNPDVTPYLANAVSPPLAHEAGWKDTVVVYPGQVTRLAVRWAPTDKPVTSPANLFFPFDPSGSGRWNYVWHCHIIDHEDNEMMRPDFVTPNPAAATRLLQKGVHY